MLDISAWIYCCYYNIVVIMLFFCHSYNRFTRVFTVPPGRDGVYYFSMYLLVQSAERAHFDMCFNDDVICSTCLDHSNLENGYVPGT